MSNDYIFDNDYRKLAKKLNQRLREAEKSEMFTPDILAIQLELRLQGRTRFSETGKEETLEKLIAKKNKLEELSNLPQTTITDYKKSLGVSSSTQLQVEGGFVIDVETGELKDKIYSPETAIEDDESEAEIQKDYEYSDSPDDFYDDYAYDFEEEKPSDYEEKASYSDYEEFPVETDLVISGFKSFVKNFPDRVSVPMLDALDALIEMTSAEDVARALFNLPETYHTYLYYVKMGDYRKGAVQISSNLLNMIPNLTDSQRQSIEDEITAIIYDDINSEIID